MSLINKDGKLFGIINIIDLAVILLIAVVAIGGAYRLKKSSPDMVSQSNKALVQVEVTDVRQPSVDGIKEGDELYHYDKSQYFGKIVEKKVENLKQPVATDDGRLVLADVPEKYRVLLTVEGDAKSSKDITIIGGEEIRIGTQYRLKNKNIAMFGTVLGTEIEQKEK